MKRTPCEYLFWNVIPSIRREIAKSLVNDFYLNQREVSEILGLTSAAVCLYISDKRGNIKFLDKKITNEIKKSAENIIKKEHTDFIKETCRICKIIKTLKIPLL